MFDYLQAPSDEEFFFLCQRAWAASLPIRERSSAESFLARAGPPRLPPLAPIFARYARTSSGSLAMATTLS